MAHITGKYGIVYDPSQDDDDESRVLRWVLPGLALVLIVAFFSARGCMGGGKPDRKPDTVVASGGDIVRSLTTQEPKIDTRRSDFFGVTNGDGEVAPTPETPVNPTFDPRTAKSTDQQLTRRPKRRSSKVTALLARRSQAAATGNLAVEIDSIERLRTNFRDEIADVDDMLARRLGNLNRSWLFDGSSSLAVKTKVTPGKTLYQIAQEHGTTVAAVMRLNSITDSRKLKAGMMLRVLDHPKAKLRVFVASGIADLELKGKFFRRYTVKVPESTKSDTIEITRAKDGGPRSVLPRLGVVFASKTDLDEVAMLLAPESLIVLNNP